MSLPQVASNYQPLPKLIPFYAATAYAMPQKPGPELDSKGLRRSGLMSPTQLMLLLSLGSFTVVNGRSLNRLDPLTPSG